MKKYSKIAALVLTDIIFINLAFVVALMLRFDFEMRSAQFNQYLNVYANCIFMITAIKVIANFVMGLYSSLWRYAGVEEISRVCITSALGSAAVILAMLYFEQKLPRSIYIMTFMFDIIFLGVRAAKSMKIDFPWRAEEIL